jgi:hypothetical protein
MFVFLIFVDLGIEHQNLNSISSMYSAGGKYSFYEQHIHVYSKAILQHY